MHSWQLFVTVWGSAIAERECDGIHPEVEALKLVEISFIFPTADFKRGRVTSCDSTEQAGWAWQMLQDQHSTAMEVTVELFNNSGQAGKFSCRTPTGGENKTVIQTIDPIKDVYIATDCPDLRMESVHFGKSSPL